MFLFLLFCCFFILCAVAVFFNLATTTPDRSISVTRPATHSTHTVITVVCIHSCMAIDRLSFGTCITYTLPEMSFHFLKSRRWRRRAGSLVCHLEAGENKNIFLGYAQNSAGVSSSETVDA